MDQMRCVAVPGGTITYTLQKKRIKNLNLRLNERSEVILSVPYSCSVDRADELIREKSGWIFYHIARQRDRNEQELLPELAPAQARVLLQSALERVHPLVRPYGVAMPELKVRKLKTQWGNCHWAQGYITLNLALHRCPEHLRDYVALHELVHFLHHGHGANFYGAMDRLMPDWKERRTELKQYSAAILTQE